MKGFLHKFLLTRKMDGMLQLIIFYQVLENLMSRAEEQLIFGFVMLVKMGLLKARKEMIADIII